MFRFLSFVFGIAAGFTLALVLLPIPGKTFFNRMSRLPSSAKDLVDHSISLGISFFRLVFVVGKEFNHRFSDIIKGTKAKIDELNDVYSAEFDKFKARRNGSPDKNREEVRV
jgi:hypothetical protein